MSRNLIERARLPSATGRSRPIELDDSGRPVCQHRSAVCVWVAQEDPGGGGKQLPVFRRWECRNRRCRATGVQYYGSTSIKWSSGASGFHRHTEPGAQDISDELENDEETELC